MEIVINFPIDEINFFKKFLFMELQLSNHCALPKSLSLTKITIAEMATWVVKLLVEKDQGSLLNVPPTTRTTQLV